MSGGIWRLPAGGKIDRSNPLRFSFDGRQLTGFAGDTLASALLANGVHLVGRSFKYHRPRGILTAGSEEPNALVQLGRGATTEPNVRATQAELFDGLVARSQNAWPSLALDAGAVNGWFGKLFVAGFYYKTFMHPRSAWMRVYEPFIRKMAGLGRAPREPDPDFYDKMHTHCDVLVVGGGPAGLTAALAAGRSGARVILADEQNEFGGSLLSSTEAINGGPASDWAAGIIAELERLANVRLLPSTTVAGYYDHNYLIGLERRTDHLAPAARPANVSRQRLWKLRARRVVLATGAHERPVVMADNDRPGVMLASAARTYANRYAVRLGRRVVVVTSNDSAYRTALDLADAGIAIVAVVDLRPDGGAPGEVIRRRGIDVLHGSTVVAIHGRRHVKAVEIAELDPSGSRINGRPRRLECDLVAMSGGWNPAAHLFSQSGGQLRFDDALQCFVPDRAVQAVRCAGACNGAFDLAACLAEGAEAGLAAAGLAGFDAEPLPVPEMDAPVDVPPGAIGLVPGKRPLGRGRVKHFVDFQNDVTAADLALAHREGYRHVEHLKRYTTTGMGTDQGKTSNVNALAILAGIRGEPIPGVGTTTFRPPYVPLSFGALAGRDVGALADPARVTPMHAWHLARGAVFEDVGQWKRPRYFPLPGEDMAAAVNRECRAVREAVGVLDASTLGKIDVQGPDAGRFLDLLYTGAMSKLAPGKGRYALLCKEDGMVLDDGICVRIAPSRYFLTTSTGNAARVLDWLEDYRQTEFPELRVWLTSVTEHWAVAQIAGPRARDLLRKLAPDTVLDAEGFPFMTFKDAPVAGIPSRIYRVSFTGELSFEVNVPAQYGARLWEAVFEAGAEFGVTPFGTEAMHVLRAEKGYIIVGQETDGTVTPFDLGLGWAVSKAKADFVGKRSWSRPDTARKERKQLVGLLTDESTFVLPEGAQLVETVTDVRPLPMVGHVSSSYWSETLGRSIALALVEGGQARHGSRLFAPLADRVLACTVTAPVFHEAEGSHANA